MVSINQVAFDFFIERKKIYFVINYNRQLNEHYKTDD